MAFVEETLAQNNDALLDYIVPGFQKMFISDSALLDRLKKTSKDVYGRNILIKYKLHGNAKGGWAGERATLPTAGARGWDEGSATLRYFYAPVDLSGQEMEVPHGKKGAIVDLYADAFEDTAQLALHKVDVAMFGNGTGRLAQINGTTTTYTGGLTRITFDHGLAENFLERQSISFGTDTTEWEITAIDADNSYLWIDGDCRPGTVGYTADDAYIYNYGSYSASYDKEITGIKMHAMDTMSPLAAYQGFDRTATGFDFTLGYWNDNSGTDRVLTPLLLTQHFQKMKRRSGTVPNLVLTEEGVLNSFILLLDSMKQPIEPMPTETGTKAVYKFVFMGKPIELEVYLHCDLGYMYTLNTDYLEIRQARPFTWDTSGGGQMTKSETTDTQWGRMKWYFQQICTNNKAQGCILDIKRNAIA
jgi:hypothetical protein